MKDEQVWITSDQGPNCTVMSTLTGTQTKKKILFIKKTHFQTQLHDSKSTDNTRETLFERERLSHRL